MKLDGRDEISARVPAASHTDRPPGGSNDSSRARRRLGDVLAGITLVLLFALAVAFHEARTTFLDLAFHLYEHATTGEIAIQNHRFVSALTQWVPVTLLEGGLEMRWVQLAYSLAFPVLYGLTWLALRWPLRSPAWALAWILPWLTFVTHDHYWIQSELPQGLAVVTLALALVGCRPRRPAYRILAKAALPLLLFTAAFAHPLLVVPMTFALGFLALMRLAPKQEIAAGALVYYGAYAVRALFFATEYDGQAGNPAEGLLGFVRGDLPSSIPTLLTNLGALYYGFVTVLALGSWLLWRGGWRWAAVWTLGAVGGHLALVAVSYPGPDVAAFYIENLYLPAGWMAAVGLAFGWAATGWAAPKPAIVWLIAALALARLGHIAYVGLDTYQPRLRRLTADLERYADQKTFLVKTPDLTAAYIMTWGTGYEAWVWSARRGLPTRGFLIAEAPQNFAWALNDPDRLVTEFLMPRFDELPARYFANPDTTRGYRVVRPEAPSPMQ